MHSAFTYTAKIIIHNALQITLFFNYNEHLLSRKKYSPCMNYKSQVNLPYAACWTILITSLVMAEVVLLLVCRRHRKQ